MATTTNSWPEQYRLRPTTNVPNNDLPALIYRNVLPTPVNSEITKQLCEGNGWEKRVSLCNVTENVLLMLTPNQGEWGVIKIPHFHPNTHECYGKAHASKIEIYSE